MNAFAPFHANLNESHLEGNECTLSGHKSLGYVGVTIKHTRNLVHVIVSAHQGTSDYTKSQTVAADHNYQEQSKHQVVSH